MTWINKKIKAAIITLISIACFGCTGTITATKKSCKVKGFGAVEGSIEIEGMKCSVKKGLVNMPTLKVNN